MSIITINSRPGCTTVDVDGVRLNRLTSIAVSLSREALPEVAVTMAAQDADMNFDSASLKINGLDMPEAVETALLEYLCNKYPMRTMVARATGGLFDAVKTAPAQ